MMTPRCAAFAHRGAFFVHEDEWSSGFRGLQWREPMPSTTVIPAKPVETALTAKSKATIPSGPAIPPRHGPVVVEEAVRYRAYLRWEAAGMPDGDGVNFW